MMHRCMALPSRFTPLCLQLVVACLATTKVASLSTVPIFFTAANVTGDGAHVFVASQRHSVLEQPTIAMDRLGESELEPPAETNAADKGQKGEWDTKRFMSDKSWSTRDKERSLTDRVTDISVSDGFVWNLPCFVAGILAGIFISLLAIGFMARFAVSRLESEVKSGDSRSCGNPEQVATVAIETLAPSTSAGATRHTKVPADHCDEDVESIQHFGPRCSVLVAMLIIQSLSTFILVNFHGLIVHYPSIVYFFTMLVGLGGNAGGQSVVLAVRSLAFGETVSVREQAVVGMKLSVVLAPLAYGRAAWQGCSSVICFVVGTSAFFIATVATVLGTALPLLLHELRIDPAHSAPIIQVTMDMIGITIVCVVGHTLVNSPEFVNM